MKKIISAIGAIILLFLVVIILVIYVRYGGGGELADLTTQPSRSIAEVEVVARLEMPPCNIAVSDGGRIFFMIPELLFNKKVPAKFENTVHAIGFSILLAVMAYTFIQDFINPIVLPK